MNEQNLHTKELSIGENKNIPVDALVSLTPYYQDDMTIIYNCDSLTAMVALRPSVNEIIIVTDPPYGINAAGKNFANGTSKNIGMYSEGNWDKEKPLRIYFEMMKLISRHQIIFGGNYYNSILGDARGMIFWDKGTGDNSYADGELAWTSFDKPIKKYDLTWVGANAKDRFSKREHPTQKPIELMVAIIEDYTTPAEIICDPFMGSGTTLVAAKQLGRKAIGIEINKAYCEIAVKRLKTLQTRLVM